MERTIKPYQELTIADDFMFAIVMSDPEISKPFLEAVLQKKIARIEVIDSQKDLGDDYDNHGIRLDVYLEDAAGTKYDIEMQTTRQKDLEKRIRYYQSGIDRRMLRKSLDYDKLNDSYIIFVCLKDYYGAGLAMYERVSTIKDAPEAAYEDGSHAIILNASYKTANANPAVLEFLRYAKDTYEGKQFDSTKSQYLTKIEKVIKIAKQDEGKEKGYMTYALKMHETFKEGYTDGEADGLARGKSEMLFSIVASMHAQGTPAEDIARMIGQPLDVVQDIIAKIEAKRA